MAAQTNSDNAPANYATRLLDNAFPTACFETRAPKIETLLYILDNTNNEPRKSMSRESTPTPS